MLQVATKQQKKDFFNTLTVTLTMSLFFCAFFVYTFIIHKLELGILHTIQESSPLFVERYTDLFLAYQFLRERVINQKDSTLELSLNVPAEDIGYNGMDSLEDYYHTKSM